ncbi:MAG: hypothetical protein PVJ49_09335 [Acidobacteriota bacterium]|jgi:hypothetical protein
MNRKYSIGTISILLTAAVALGGSALAASQDAQKATGHQAQAADSSARVPAACQQMMTAANGYMADVQQMMTEMHQGQASEETDESHGMIGGSSGMAGGSHGMMGGSSGMADGSHGMMGGSRGMNGMTAGMMGNLAGMMESMMGTMGTMANTDPSTIDDAATAEQEAQVLETMVASMRPHLDQMQAQAAALRKRASEIR